VIVPFVGDHIAPFIDEILGFVPLFHASNPTGYGLLAGGVVLAVMVFPFIITVSEEVIGAVPDSLRESSLALGATRWETIRRVVLRRAWPGMMAAVVLGFTRALGETMAVLMVVGNVPQVPRSIFDAAYPLTALIANNYGEMMSIPLYDSALMTAALLLLIIVLGFNLVSRLILIKLVQLD
jgi:phosphate transport system permease protein